MNEHHPPQILLAAAAVSVEPLTRALGDRYQCQHVSTMFQAKALLEQPCDLIVCGLYFDDSRMFDLLRHAKSDERTRRIPFVVVKASDGELSPTVQQGIEIACAALGADRFVEFTTWEKREGNAAAQQRLHGLIDKLLLA